MDWTRPIDQYCERLDPGFWAEPLNFWSNAAFLLAGFCGWLKWRELQRTSTVRAPELGVLSVLALVIGVGSALFHSVAELWSMLADVVPIGIYLVVYLFIFLRCWLRSSWRVTVGGLVAFGLVTALFAVLVDRAAVNGSNTYFGTAVTLAVMGAYVGRRELPGRRYYYIAAVTFALSLVFRSIDMAVCPGWPLGTHFLWHTLNGVVIYLSLAAGSELAGRATNSL